MYCMYFLRISALKFIRNQRIKYSCTIVLWGREKELFDYMCVCAYLPKMAMLFISLISLDWTFLLFKFPKCSIHSQSQQFCMAHEITFYRTMIFVKFYSQIQNHIVCMFDTCMYIYLYASLSFGWVCLLDWNIWALMIITHAAHRITKVVCCSQKHNAYEQWTNCTYMWACEECKQTETELSKKNGLSMKT